jgi:hypothetical protein
MVAEDLVAPHIRRQDHAGATGIFDLSCDIASHRLSLSDNRSRSLLSASMSGMGRERLSESLANLIAKGEVRPPLGPRVLPLPVKLQPPHKTASEWVADGRR